MEAILFVGHGSKKDEGNQQIIDFIEILKGELADYIVETSFLEFAKPTIAQGIKACVDKGATKVALIPMMFFSAGHAKIHIPHEIDEAKEMYPNVSFSYGRPVGIHEKLFSIFKSRLQDVNFNEDEFGPDTSIILVGRGSSDAHANSELYKIGRLLSERLNMVNVELSFIGVTTPTVEDAMEKCVKLGANKIWVIPYFFFTGILIDRMEAKLATFKQQYSDLSIEMTDYFGFHPELVTIFIDRAKEALEGEAKLNCDMCEFRLHALEHMDVHHHHHHDHDHDHDHHHHHHGHHHHHHEHSHK